MKVIREKTAMQSTHKHRNSIHKTVARQPVQTLATLGANKVSTFVPNKHNNGYSIVR